MDQLRIAACKPVNDPRVPKQIGETKLVPMVDDTITKCDYCRQDIWIGPKQKMLVALGYAKPACYVCAISESSKHAMPGETVPLINLDPNREERPRT